MKPFLTIVKIVALLVLLAASYVGYRYFRAWQANARPAVSDISWDNSEVTLGKPAVLSATVRVPWHREITSPVPVRAPESLVAAQHGGKLVRGKLDLSGHRTWKVSFPMVPTTLDKVEAQFVEIPLSATRRISSDAVTIPLPALEVVLPKKMAEKLVIADKPLRPDAPPAEAPEIIEEEKKPFPTVLVAAVAAVAALLFLIVRWMRRPKAVVPPWITAQRELDELNQNPPGEPAVFFLRLTDILKRYTSKRFETPADAASSTELLASLGSIPEFRGNLSAPLTKVVRQADSAKFASAQFDGDARSEALGKVREFVGTTTPKEEEENADA